MDGARQRLKTFEHNIGLSHLSGLLTLLVLIVWHSFDMFFYKPQAVAITDVKKLCFAELDTGGKGGNLVAVFSRPTLSTADCDALRRKRAVDPDLRGHRLMEATYVMFAYQSPVDDRTHQGKLRRRSNDDGGPIKPGDRITI
jgi:hypothetical protein